MWYNFMKKFLLIAIIFLMVSSISLQADSQNELPIDSWTSKDKFSHLAASTFLYCWHYEIFNKPFKLDDNESAVWALNLTLLYGIGKECYDLMKENNFFSYKDLIFDIFGCLAGMIITNNM